MLAVAFAALQPQSHGDEGEYDSVQYDTVREYEGYEERRYTNVHFACTELTYDVAEEDENMDLMYEKVLPYFAGDNSEAQEIKMAVPIISMLVPLKDNKMLKQLCFFLPKKFEENPPPKTFDKDLFSVKGKEWVVFVKKFGDYAMRDSVWMDNAAAFREELAERADEVIEGYFYTASYNNPMKFMNEVMFEKKSSKVLYRFY